MSPIKPSSLIHLGWFPSTVDFLCKRTGTGGIEELLLGSLAMLHRDTSLGPRAIPSRTPRRPGLTEGRHSSSSTQLWRGFRNPETPANERSAQHPGAKDEPITSTVKPESAKNSEHKPTCKSTCPSCKQGVLKPNRLSEPTSTRSQENMG